MSIIFNQLVINKMNIPVELTDIIKSYSFYDINIAKMISFIKTKKQEIVRIFKYGFSTRKNPFDSYYSTNTNYRCEEQWAICLTNYNNQDGRPLVHEREFQSINCNKCGNYKLSRSILCERTQCFCFENENDLVIDDEYLENRQNQIEFDYLENPEMFLYDHDEAYN